MAYQLNVAALWFEYATNSEEALKVFSIDQLLATEHVDKVECLRQDDFSLGIDDTDHWIVCRLLQPSRLDYDPEPL